MVRFRVTAVVVIGAEVLVGRLTNEEMVGDDEDRMSHRDDGSLVVSMSPDAPIPCSEGAVLDVDGHRRVSARWPSSRRSAPSFIQTYSRNEHDDDAINMNALPADLTEG